MTSKKPKVFVIGDLILDHYVEGIASHICPEAPVPVLVLTEASYTRPGGAWNVCANLMQAGAEVTFFGVDGVSQMREQLQRETFRAGSCHILVDEHRTTQIKTRYIGQYGQQLLRVDTQKDDHISDEQARQLIEMINAQKDHPDCIVIADYGCGTITRTLIAGLRDNFLCDIIVDPHPSQEYGIYNGVDIVKMNSYECNVLVGEHDDVTSVAPIVIITDGGDDLVIVTPETDYVLKIPQLDLVDPCGAGDAFVAYMAAARASGHNVMDSVMTGIYAGSCAVSHRGVHVVTPEEIDQLVSQQKSG